MNTETRPWIHGGPEPRRAGVNAFGFGGINAHAVLEEMPAALPLDHLPPWESEVCVLQGDSPAALVEQATRLVQRLETRSPAFSLADLAYTLNCGSDWADNAVRLAIVADVARGSSGEAGAGGREAGAARLPAHQGHLGHLLRGGAARHGRGRSCSCSPARARSIPNMLADLCLHFPEVREGIRSCRPDLRRRTARLCHERLGLSRDRRSPTRSAARRRSV